jgi:sirohydrochlorin ferrochelatase
MNAMATRSKSKSTDRKHTGVIIVDHGSRRRESNDMLLEVVRRYAAQSRFAIVEPAHMEIAQPSIAAAFDGCVARGARRVVVMPYFLLPGKHWDQDIPRLTAEAAQKHPGVAFMVTAPLGLHPMIHKVIEARIDHCVKHAGGRGPECEVCRGAGKCVMRTVVG